MPKQPSKGTTPRSMKEQLDDVMTDIKGSAAAAAEAFTGDGIPVVPTKGYQSPDFATFDDARIYLTFDKKGVPSIRKRDSILDEPRRAGAANAITALQHALPITVGNLKEWVAPFGIILVSGGSGVGKSEFMRALGRLIDVNRVIAVEPADSQEELENVPIRFSADAALAYLISARINGSKALPVLDSLREPLFEIEGTAADKGIINAFFTRVTRVSNTLALNGMTVFATINPLSQDDAFMKAFMPRLISSTPAYILLDERSETSTGITFKGRMAQRPERKERQFSLFVPKNAEIKPHAEEVEFVIADEPTFQEGSVTERRLINEISKTV